MGRIASRNARLYMNITSGGTAEPIAFISTFELNAASDRFEVTAFGDSSKTYVAGLPDSSGSFNGFYDDSTQQTYQSAVDGVARKWYFYPSTSSTSQYWFGTAFFDFTIGNDVSGATTISGSWSAATPTSKVG